LINSGLLLSKGEGKNAENFFLLTVQPPKRIDPAYIPPREYVFVLDVSGSMNGFPSVMAKKTILNLLDKLNKDDKFNLILFASGFDVFSENLVNASRGNLEKAFKFMAESRQGGGTELLPALETALKMPKNSKASRSIVVITDGLIDFESKAFKLIRDNLNKANVFTFGIGTQMNKLTIEGMAKAGMGLSFELDRVEDAEYQSERFIKYISTPILADIKVTYDGFGVSEVEPMSVPDLFPDRPIVIYGKWDGNLQGGIKIEAINGQDKIFVDLPVIKFGEMVQGDALKQLWARKQIELLSDYQSFGERDKYKKEITDLGLKYNLMTAYTSFIAVDNEVVPTIDKETNNNGNVPELYIKDGSPVKYIGQGQITNYQTTENITVRDALQKKPNLNGSLNNFTSQGFEVRNARSEDYQLTVDGQRISNAFVGGMGSSESSYSSICSQSSGAESSSSGLFMDDYSNSSVKHFFNQLSGDNETKKLSYDRQELEKNIKIIKNKLKLNINANGSLKVFVNSKGKITKIEPDSSNSDLLNQIALEAIKKTSFEFAKQSGFPIDGSIDIDISINVDDCDYNLIFDNQPYVMKFINNDNMKIWQTIIRIGEGRAINHLDKIKIEYFIYNENLKLINKDTVTVVADLGDAIKPVAESLKDMKVGGEKLLLFKTFYFTTGLYPMIKENPKSDFVFLKIKVLEINP